MTVKELKSAIENLDDNAVVLIPFLKPSEFLRTGYSDYEDGEFYEADIAGAGYCDPESTSTDGLYIELHSTGMLPVVSGKCFQVIAFCKARKRNNEGGVPVFETG